jgi:hypothetical protein
MSATVSTRLNAIAAVAAVVDECTGCECTADDDIAHGGGYAAAECLCRLWPSVHPDGYTVHRTLDAQSTYALSVILADLVFRGRCVARVDDGECAAAALSPCHGDVFFNIDAVSVVHRLMLLGHRVSMGADDTGSAAVVVTASRTLWGNRRADGPPDSIVRGCRDVDGNAPSDERVGAALLVLFEVPDATVPLLTAAQNQPGSSYRFPHTDVFTRLGHTVHGSHGSGRVLAVEVNPFSGYGQRQLDAWT